MASLGDLVARVGANIDGYMSAMDTVVSKAGTTADQVETRFAKFETVGAAMAKIGVGLTAGLTVPIVGIGAAALTAAGDMEQAQIAFTTLLGSGTAATAMLTSLRDFAAKTPFNFPELVAATQRMLALGFAATDVIPTLTTVGNTASALKGGTEEINRIIRALGQMRNAGNLTAQDMNQLTDVGVQGWKYLSEATGISLSDIRDKAKEVLTGAQAAQIILQGMATDFAGGMQAQSQSLVGQWSTVKDSITFALADIGTALLPAAKAFVENFATPMLSGLTSLTTWFSGLPEPIKSGALALGALLAAAGPVTVAIGALGMAIPAVTAGLTAIAGVVGLAVAPMLATAAAVGAVAVALVALGTWVASNWEPIRATVLQAWEGIAELWGAVWNPIAGFLTGIWEGIAGAASSVWTPIADFFAGLWAPIAPVFLNTWNAIGKGLSQIWDGIKSAASSVWNFIIDAIGDFLKWAAKIPGVNKLFNLSEAWKNAEKLATKTKAATTEVKKHADAHKSAVPIIKTSTEGVEKHGKAHKDAEPYVRKMSQAQADHLVKVQNLKRGLDDATDELMLLDAEIRSGRGPIELFARALDGIKVSLHSLMPDFTTFSNVMDAVGRQASATADAFGESMKRLRITSTTELKATADSATDDYGRISDSGIATKGEIEQAWRAMTEAQIAYRRSIGEDVSALEAELEKQENVHKSHGQAVKTVWGQIGDDISRALDQASLRLSDAMRDLFTGEFSFSKVGDVFKQLGLDIASAFLDVGAKAITDFIKNHIGALLEALGGLLSKIPVIGDALGGIFGKIGGSLPGGGGTSPTTPPTFPGTGGQQGGQQGGGGGMGVGSGGATATGAAIGTLIAPGIGTAVGAAIGGLIDLSVAIANLFGQARQENTLNAIEENTRFSRSYGLLGISLDLEYFPYLKSISDLLWTVGTTAWVETITEIQESKMFLRDLIFKTADMLNVALVTRDYTIATYELLSEGLTMPSVSVAPLSFAGVAPSVAGGMVNHFDFRGATISDDQAAERLAQKITDRIRSVVR